LPTWISVPFQNGINFSILRADVALLFPKSK
jgi:hypothetical protein